MFWQKHETPPNIMTKLQNPKPIAMLAFTITSLFIFITVAPAAYAEPINNFASVPTFKTIKVETQSFKVSSLAVTVVPARDSYTATTHEEIVAAAAAAQAAAASLNSRNFSVPNISGVAPGQIIPASSIIAAAQSWVGLVPYGNGNNPSDSFACDGYVQYVFAQNGISLPRGADEQAALGVAIPFSQGQAGDLIWWPGQHIGIYDGAGGYYDSPDWGRYVQHGTYLWGTPIIIRLT